MLTSTAACITMSHYLCARSGHRDDGLLIQDWEDPSEFYGCGQFCSDSWRIFCRGDLSGKGVQDKKLQKYVRWWQTGSAQEPPEETSQPGPRRKKGRPRYIGGTVLSVPYGYDSCNGLSSSAAKTEVAAPARSGRVLRSGLCT